MFPKIYAKVQILELSVHHKLIFLTWWRHLPYNPLFCGSLLRFYEALRTSVSELRRYTSFSRNNYDNLGCGVMPLFLVKRRYFDFYRFGKKNVELRAVKPQWKNSKPRDIATI